MEIVLLKEYPQYKREVSEWLTNEFGTSKSLNFYSEIIHHSLNEGNDLPITFIALDNEELVGTIGLWRCDFLPRQDVFPWCAALIVRKDKRKSGIGAMLQEHVINYSKKLEYNNLYLFTELKSYFEKTGWRKYGVGYEYNGGEVTIYQYDLRKCTE